MSFSPMVGLEYRLFLEDVPYPIWMGPVPGLDALVIASKDGRLWIYERGVLRSEPYLDLRDAVRNDGEQGLLGVAFAPDHADSGRLFLHYTATDGSTTLAEFTSSGGIVDPTTEQVVFQVSQPARNHNGGHIAFGPEGYLYMALGDGGASNDRFGNGQNTESTLGALLRFDISTPGVAAPAAGNPFAAEEIWSVGLRNPWRFDIDFETGLIVIADVGQNLYEEVSVASVVEPGINYGWPITEGLHCFSPRTDCDTAGLTLPVLEIAHGDGGTCSVTGGVVYRGLAIPELAGHYLFSDYCGGYLRTLALDGSGADPVDWTEQVGVAGRVVSFGTDADGEVYVLTAGGDILQIAAARS